MLCCDFLVQLDSVIGLSPNILYSSHVRYSLGQIFVVIKQMFPISQCKWYYIAQDMIAYLDLRESREETHTLVKLYNIS